MDDVATLTPSLTESAPSPCIVIPSTRDISGWVGKEGYDTSGACWTLVKDAFATVGVKLPKGYYDGIQYFVTVHTGPVGPVGPFAPQPWDMVMARTLRALPWIVNHCALALDGERIIHAWLENDGASRGVIISEIATLKHVAGVLRLREDMWPK